MSVLDTIREKLPSFVNPIGSVEITRQVVLKWAAYTIYGLIIFALVFAAKYYVQQSDELAREATASLEGVSVEFSYLEPQLFPPRVTLDYLRIYEKKTKKPLLLLKDTDIKLSVFPLLVGKVSLSVQSRLYGGLMNADVATGALFNTGRVSADLKLDMVELEKIPQVKEYDRSLKGFASVETSFGGELAVPSSIEGDFLLKIDQLDMENRFPIVKGARLKDFKVVLDCTHLDGLLTVRDFDLTSKDGISLKSEGTVAVNESDFNKSELDMKGKFIGPLNRLAASVLDPKVVALLKNKKAVPLTIKKSLDSPKLELR